jgi:hypothetical protein
MNHSIFDSFAKHYTTYFDQHSPITEPNALKGHLLRRFPLTASQSPSSPSNPIFLLHPVGSFTISSKTLGLLPD